MPKLAKLLSLLCAGLLLELRSWYLQRSIALCATELSRMEKDLVEMEQEQFFITSQTARLKRQFRSIYHVS